MLSFAQKAMKDTEKAEAAAEIASIERPLYALEEELQAELGLTPEEAVSLLVKAAVKTGKKKYLEPGNYLREKYLFEPVSPTQWISDPAYFGHVGSNMWPVLKDDFIKIMEAKPRPLRVGFTGSIGWGKSFLSEAIAGRLLYEVLCLRNPQEFYGLSLSSWISFMNLAITATHARRVFFAGLREMIDGSAWFRTKMRRDMDVQSVLTWPARKVSFVPGSSNELSALGENLFGGVIEEANFFQVSTTSMKIKSASEREWDQAKKLHDSMWRRMTSRYARMGRFPGMLILNSSASYPDDFMDRVIQENDPTTMIIHHAEWETKPAHRFSGKKFFVFPGSQTRAVKILDTPEEVERFRKIGEVQEVPIEYESSARRDPEGFVRDVMGINCRSSNRFFTNSDALAKAFTDTSIPIPFREDFINGMDANFLSGSLLYYKMLAPKAPGQKYAIPKIHPAAPRFAHIDLGVSNDNCGLCVCHIGGMEETERLSDDPNSVKVVKESVPVIYIDLVLKIIPPLEGEVQIEDVRNVLYDLRDKVGFNFLKITYDQWQSKESQQTLARRFGEDVVAHLSVAKSADAYIVLKETIYEGRLHCYAYPPLVKELQGLVYDPKGNKINHLPNAHDDVSQALAGAVFNAVTNSDYAIRDRIVHAPPVDEKTMEEKLADETRAWLLGEPVKSTEDDPLNPDVLEREVLEGQEDPDFKITSPGGRFYGGW
jgi:hypothetical protein